MTASDVKSQIEFYESLQNMTLDEENVDEAEVVEGGESVEVEVEE